MSVWFRNSFCRYMYVHTKRVWHENYDRAYIKPLGKASRHENYIKAGYYNSMAQESIFQVCKSKYGKRIMTEHNILPVWNRNFLQLC